MWDFDGNGIFYRKATEWKKFFTFFPVRSAFSGKFIIFRTVYTREVRTLSMHGNPVVDRREWLTEDEFIIKKLIGNG